jgi:hypothetical protein
MFRESNLDVSTSRATAGEGALRHPDGSINFDAYRERARQARTVAITASIGGALSLISGMFAGKPRPAAKHHAT